MNKGANINNQLLFNRVLMYITQAIDNVWHNDLISKVKHNLHYHFYHTLRKYIVLADWAFLVKIGEQSTTPRSIKSGMPQSSVLGPVVYLSSAKVANF